MAIYTSEFIIPVRTYCYNTFRVVILWILQHNVGIVVKSSTSYLKGSMFRPRLWSSRAFRIKKII